MKPLIKLYLKIFLATGIPFGLIMMGFDYLEGTELKLWKFLFLSLFFGITMSFFLVYSQKKHIKKNGMEKLSGNYLGVNHSKEIKTKLSKIKLLDLLITEETLQKTKIIETENGINIKTNLNLKWWGEEINISLESEKEQYYTYRVSSCPKLKTTLIDYGKNLKNVNLIESIIRKHHLT